MNKLEKTSISDEMTYCWFLRSIYNDVISFVNINGNVTYLQPYMHVEELEYHNVICFEI